MSEAALHRAVAQYLTLALPATDCWWTTFPSGGGGKVRGAQLKAMGLKPGVPDILVINAHSLVASELMWLELKTERGRLSVDQRRCHADLERLGCYVEVCRSIDDVSKALTKFGIQPRARAA